MKFIEKVESTIHWKTSTFLKKQKKLKLKGKPRWRSEDEDRFYEWDELHGDIEVYNSRGKHIGVLNSDGSPSTKKAVAGRTIDV